MHNFMGPLEFGILPLSMSVCQQHSLIVVDEFSGGPKVGVLDFLPFLFHDQS